ncbi:MAG: 7-cyano-7-deazaguanine synthase QueC [Pseudomonadales bacterium]|jgi:7-cyano-7-deazaguanine synthase|nr:7-cyano-7-deazaguanine synthase QueC [Pseudomonadales bacterium]
MSPVTEHGLPPGEGAVAVVLLSGGLDSATVLAMATAANWRCVTVAFDYGQKHRAELLAAERVSAALGAVEHRLVHLDAAAFSGSALTDADIAVPEGPTEGIPVTYVPARNTIFLAHGLGIAEVLGARAICIGVNAVDYSGYPDCRPAFVAAFETMANLATRAGVEGRGLTVAAPLLQLSKAEIVQAGAALGVDYGLTVSCYQASDDGRACGRCEACRLRREGFEAAGLEDPTRYVGG